MKEPNSKPAETAERLAVLYNSTAYGIEPFLTIFEAITDKYNKEEREEVRRLFNQNISKRNHLNYE